MCTHAHTTWVNCMVCPGIENSCSQKKKKCKKRIHFIYALLIDLKLGGAKVEW